MPRVKMPTGEIVDMPDNPTPDQLSQLAALQGTPSQQMGSNPGLPGGSGPAQPVVPEDTKHKPWGPKGSTLRFLQNVMATPQEGFGNSTLNQLSHGVGLGAGMLAKGVTGTAGVLADAGAGVANMAGAHMPMPSQQLAQQFPQPQGAAEHVADFAGTMAAGGMGDPISRLAQQHFGPTPAQARQPTPEEITMQEGRRAGYVAPPSQSPKQSTIGRLAEYAADKPSVSRIADIKNQDVTDKLARQAAGLAPDAHLTDDTLKTAMSKTYNQGYEPLKAVGQMTNGSTYRHALDDALTEFQGASTDYPDAVKHEVADLIDAHRVNTFTAKGAIKRIQGLRSAASDAFANHNADLGKANMAVADAIEKSIELNLKGAPIQSRVPNASELLDNYRNARTLLSKQNVVANAVREGTGHANAANVAGQLQRHPGKLTDELKTMGQFASDHPSITSIPKEGMPMPKYGILNNIASLAAGAVGGPLAGVGVAGMPVAKLGLAHALTRPMMQKMFTDPNLDPGMLRTLFSNPALFRSLPAAAGETERGLYGQ